MNQSLKKKTIKNLIFSIIAQSISIILSIIMSLLIPKILGIKEFGYWQLFLFYINYVGLFHFGITDGMYLKTGGITLENVNKRELSSQFYFLCIILLIIFLGICVLSITYFDSTIRKIILICTGLYMIIANMNWFIGYIFQATNNVKIYSISIMIDKLVFLLLLIFLFIFQIQNIIFYMILYIFSTLIALLYNINKSKNILKVFPFPIKETIKISLKSAKIGISLTLASVSSFLILGIGRFFVDAEWGIEVFGKFSFALSLTNFFLLFIGQTSVVLFPTLRQVSSKSSRELYKKFNNYLYAFLPAILILYIPAKIILGVWLPQYAISLEYLALLLPICIFDGKTQMINNTYFKVLRLEKKLLKINIFTIIISFIFAILGVYVFKNIYIVIIGMLLAIIFRCVLGDIILSKKLSLKNNVRTLLFMTLLSFIFILLNLFCSEIIIIILTIVCMLLYLVVTKLYIEYEILILKILKKAN